MPFVIDDIIAAALAASAAGGAAGTGAAAAGGLGAAGAAGGLGAAGAAGGLGSAGLGMAGMGGLGAATPALLGGGMAGGGMAGAGGAGASLLGTGGLGAGLGPEIAANLVNPMTVAPEGIGGGMSVGTAKAPLDYWKIMQYMNMANKGASALQGQGDRTISAPPAQRPHAQMVSPQATNNVRMFDPNRYPYNTRLSLFGRR